MPVVLKSGNLILLETSGPVQACNGIAPPLSDVKLLISEYLINCSDEFVDIISYSLWKSVSPKGKIYYNFLGSKILRSIMSTVTVSK